MFVGCTDRGDAMVSVVRQSSCTHKKPFGYFNLWDPTNCQAYHSFIFSFQKTLVVGILIDSPIHRLRGMPHLYLQNSRCEVCKLGESRLGYIDVPRSFSAPGARINDSNKNAFSGSIAYYDNRISEISGAYRQQYYLHSRNWKHLGFVSHPFRVRAHAKELSYHRSCI